MDGVDDMDPEAVTKIPISFMPMKSPRLPRSRGFTGYKTVCIYPHRLVSTFDNRFITLHTCVDIWPERLIKSGNNFSEVAGFGRLCAKVMTYPIFHKILTSNRYANGGIKKAPVFNAFSGHHLTMK